jgi:asparagine synthase (glutamine-hydrolysing)
MCGIAGVVRRDDRPVPVAVLRRMASAIGHRGPDGFGYYSGVRCGLAHVRLSIIDVTGGAQPLGNEDGRILIVYNGEVYNYRELRRELEGRGHRFRTRTDTEVLVHGYEEWGRAMLQRLNGQFAFALYDRHAGSLFLARDRFGVCPLFYAQRHGDLYFASEAKALFASGEILAEPDPRGIDEVFTFWAARPPRTVFRDVLSLEPGTYAEWQNGTLRIGRYYEIAYPESDVEPPDAVRSLDWLLRDGVSLRLRADVPVGGYLSGGLDSSITCALAAEQSPHRLRTFSVTFDDPVLDESAYQRVVAEQVRSRHAVQAIGQREIAEVFPEVVWHAETPLLRTAPAPLFLLSRLAREHDIKVVLTGEGSDEIFLGYDLFKETAVRLFCLRQPGSAVRPRLFDRLYPYIESKGRGGELWRQFFLSAGGIEDPLFSHLPRFRLAAWGKAFYSAAMRAAVPEADALDELRASLPPAFMRWSPLNRAAYLEMTTLLSPYLLSSQGERMAMAHGVEGRYPFLDHRLVELASALPTHSKLCGLREKEILRRWAASCVPTAVRARPKQPYRAPDIPAFFAQESEYLAEVTGTPAVARAGLFDPPSVRALVARCRAGRATSARESQALVGIVSAQLWYAAFFERAVFTEDDRRPDLALIDTAGVAGADLVPLEAQ